MNNEKLLVFGAGKHGLRLALALQLNRHTVLGFVTTQQSTHQEVNGLPIYTWETIPHNLRGECTIAIGIFNRLNAYDELAAIINANGFNRIAWPWDYYPCLHQDLGWCYWLDSNPRTLSSWQQDPDYLKFASILADSESRRILDRILAFRVGEDLSYSSYVSPENQYFNPLSLDVLPTGEPIAFLDVGAYNGDTLEMLIKHVEVIKAVLIEPDPANYRLLTNKCLKLARLYPCLNSYALPIGAGDEFAYASFSGEGEAASANFGGDPDNASTHFPTIAPLDNIMPAERFDFIKVDVEGHDLAALKGMRKILQRSHAVIAVSLYHYPRDVVYLPLALMELLDGMTYNYYLRQHMNNSFDTVLYAVPGSKRS